MPLALKPQQGEFLLRYEHDKILFILNLTISPQLRWIVPLILWKTFKTMSKVATGVAEGRATAQFMAALTHAFRGRLNALLGSLELASQTKPEDDPSRFVNSAVNEGRALLQLVNDALDLARIDAGELRLNDATLNPVAIVEGALGSIAARLHARGVSIASTIDSQTPVILRGDMMRLRQVLVNLLDNASRATEKGSVLISLGPAPGDSRGEHLLFEVSDTGQGVSEAIRDRLFDSFLPSGESSDQRLTSLGTGLALCRGLVELMGGKIHYAPRPGGGSVFSFDVVLRRDSEFERLADLVAEARGRRVLLIDADEMRRASFGKQMQSWGVNWRGVADGEAGAELLRQHDTYDLVLVHQDAPSAITALKMASGIRTVAILVPIGASPNSKLTAADGPVLWLSAPMRRRTIIDAALGRVLPSIERSEFPAAKAVARARILVVEDREANRQVMVVRLERMGCQCDAVENGADAIRLISQRRYGLVLADLSLPDMSGLEMTAAIRQIGGEAGRVPIVAVTGDTHPRTRERCLAAGMNDYLSKPVEQIELKHVVERFAPNPQSARPAWASNVIERMCGELGRDLAIDVLISFERELGQRLARMGAEQSLEQIAREAHALKSAATTFGALELGDAARLLELSCNRGLEADARPRVAALLTMGRAVRAAVQQWLEQARGGGQ